MILFGIIISEFDMQQRGLHQGQQRGQQTEQGGFRALADPTRRDILVLLSGNDMTIAQVAENFDMTRAAVKKHLTVLSDGGLITVETHGRTRVNRLNSDGIRPLMEWFALLDAAWDRRLSDLKDAIEAAHQGDMR